MLKTSKHNDDVNSLWRAGWDRFKATLIIRPFHGCPLNIPHLLFPATMSFRYNPAILLQHQAVVAQVSRMKELILRNPRRSESNRAWQVSPFKVSRSLGRAQGIENLIKHFIHQGLPMLHLHTSSAFGTRNKWHHIVIVTASTSSCVVDVPLASFTHYWCRPVLLVASRAQLWPWPWVVLKTTSLLLDEINWVQNPILHFFCLAKLLISWSH